jgi:hypothetical protein
MKINKGVEAMTRRRKSYVPDFKISSERVLRLGNKEYTFYLDFWFKVKKLKSGERP